ncbi:hypothetical protein CEXT_116301, partial [Caerostris extrusa]
PPRKAVPEYKMRAICQEQRNVARMQLTPCPRLTSSGASLPNCLDLAASASGYKIARIFLAGIQGNQGTGWCVVTFALSFHPAIEGRHKTPKNVNNSSHMQSTPLDCKMRSPNSVAQTRQEMFERPGMPRDLASCQETFQESSSLILGRTDTSLVKRPRRRQRGGPGAERGTSRPTANHRFIRRSVNWRLRTG